MKAICKMSVSTVATALVALAGIMLVSCNALTGPNEDLRGLQGSVRIDSMDAKHAPLSGGKVYVNGTLEAMPSNLGNEEGLSYLWRRGREHVLSGEGPQYKTYRLADADFGCSITVAVFRKDYDGAVISEPTLPVLIDPSTPGTKNINDVAFATIDGRPEVGAQLQARIEARGQEGPFLQENAFFQWMQSPDGNISENGTVIGGADESRYIIVKADVGKWDGIFIVYRGYSGFLSVAVGPVTEDSGIPVQGITVTPNPADVEEKGGQRQFSATPTPANASGLVKWTVDPKTAGTISDGGLLTLNSSVIQGTQRITVRATSVKNTSVSGEAVVNVTGKAARVTVDPPVALVGRGGTQQFSATTEDSAGNSSGISQQFIWITDSADAQIDADGLMTVGVNADTNRPITVRASSAANSQIYGTAKVTVVDFMLELEEGGKPLPSKGLDLGTILEGYDQNTVAKTVKITNTGGIPSGPMTIESSDPDFELRDASISNLNPGEWHEFTVLPVPGLTTTQTSQDYSTTIKIEGTEGKEEFEAFFTLADSAFFLEFTEGTGGTGAVLGTLDFGSKYEGYTSSQLRKTVTVTNESTLETGVLTISYDQQKFQVLDSSGTLITAGTDIQTIQGGNSTEIRVQPADGLTHDTYTDTVRLENANGYGEFEVKFTVNEPPKVVVDIPPLNQPGITIDYPDKISMTVPYIEIVIKDYDQSWNVKWWFNGQELNDPNDLPEPGKLIFRSEHFPFPNIYIITAFLEEGGKTYSVDIKIEITW